jgi:ribosomal protein S18 acetylase RimI-like enzyme
MVKKKSEPPAEAWPDDIIPAESIKVPPKAVPMKIRRFFNTEDKRTMFLQAQLPENEIKQALAEPYQEKGYIYLQMRLDLENITPQYEKNLEGYQKSEIKMRVAKESDIPVLTHLYNRSFMMGADPYAPITEEHMEKIMYSQPNTLVMVAHSFGKLQGFIILDLEGDQNQYGIIVGLGTDPTWRRRGIAKYLGLEAWRVFRQLKVKELRCEVYEHNYASIALIKSLDFVEYGRKTYLF